MSATDDISRPTAVMPSASRGPGSLEIDADPTVRLAVLNSMLGSDLESSLRRQRELGLVDVDLKNNVFGKEILDLTDDDVTNVAVLVAAHDMHVHCLSTRLFGDWIERGEQHFAEHHLRRVERTAEIATMLKPRMVRLLACQADERPATTDLGRHLRRHAPWIIGQYQTAASILTTTGTAVTVESEIGGSVLATPADVQSFFATLDLGDAIGFTWDVQNMWRLGTAPTVEIYRQLRPLIRYAHLKGGRAGVDGALRWASALRTASWPVGEIVAEIVADQVSPVICLNPSLGAQPPGYDRAAVAEDDLLFLRELSIGVT